MTQRRPQAVCAPEPVPASFSASVFLFCAGWDPGPSPAPPEGDGGNDGKAGAAPSLLAQALDHFGREGFDGVVLSPGDPPRAGHDPLATWQDEALRMSDVLLLCAGSAADGAELGALWGEWQRTGRVVVFAPPPPPGAKDPVIVRAALRTRAPVGRTLAEAVRHAVGLLRGGVLRRGGERAVPLMLWKSPSFQSWYRALRRAGHRLDDALVEWTYRSRGGGRPPLLWAMRPRVYIPSERRHKAGEVVIGRTDVSATVLYHRPRPRDGAPADWRDTVVVLVREFRSAVRNGTGFGLMLPGGSAAQASEREQDPRRTALKEIIEETGLNLSPEQLEPVGEPGSGGQRAGDRQLMASLSSHHAHVYRAELRDEQLALLRADSAGTNPHGANPNERCYVTLRSVRELLADPDLDWSQLGMVLLALQPA